MAESVQAYHRSFWSRLTGSAAFASLLSVGLHAAVFLAFYHAVFREEPRTRTLIIPEARLAASASPLPGTSTTADLKIEPPPSSPITTDDMLATELRSAPAMAATDPLIAAAVLGGPGDHVAAVSPSTHSSGFASAPLVGAGVAGTGGSGPTAPASRFFGQAGSAYKVVYVVDVSASLAMNLDQIKRELQLSIDALLPIQQFHIVLAEPLVVSEFGPRRLVPANAHYRKQAAEFIANLKHPTAGEADPMAAMERAFAVQPELIYFLTDGEYRRFSEQLEQKLRQLNTPLKAQITVIGFDPAPEARRLLERIATDHHGNFRKVEPE